VTGRVVHFLLHVPKCAGTTVERHFEARLGAGFLLAPRWDNPLRDVIGNRYAYAPGDARLEGVRAVSGHSLSASLMAAFADAEIRESVLLRDPVGYHVSLYNYRWTWHRKGHAPEPAPFGRWYRAQRRNPISRFLLMRYFGQGVPALYRLSSRGRLDWLEARLGRFWFVGDYRRAAEMIAGISREIGIDPRVEDHNVTGDKTVTAADLGEAWRARILADNPVDAALHARWKDRGWHPDASTGAAAAAGSTPRRGADRPSSGPSGSPAPPALPALDQPLQAAGDLASGLAKKLLR